MISADGGSELDVARCIKSARSALVALPEMAVDIVHSGNSPKMADDWFYSRALGTR